MQKLLIAGRTSSEYLRPGARSGGLEVTSLKELEDKGLMIEVKSPGLRPDLCVRVGPQNVRCVTYVK